jgi:outer membrane protein TolC
MTRPIILALVAFGTFAPAASADLLVAVPGTDSPPPALTVADCVREAILAGGEMEQERLRRGELRGQGWQAVSTGLPSLDLTANWTRSRDPSFLLDESFSGGDGDTTSLPPELSGLEDLFAFPDPDELEAQSFWRASARSEWELNPFRIANSLAAVRVRLRQHDAELAATEHAVAERAMVAFHDVVRADERTAALDADLAARREFLDLTRRRFQLELATELDTLRAAVSLANRLPAARNARRDLRDASGRLNILIGRDPDSPLALHTGVPVELDPIDPEGAVRFASHRPSLEILRLNETFLRKQRGVLHADQRPYLSLDGSVGYVARTASGVIDRDHDYWQVGVSLVVPIFDGFYTKGRVQETSATISRARRDLDEARRNAQREVASVLEELLASRENLAAAELNLTAAERALEQTTLRYDVGKAGQLEVLIAQSERFAAHSYVIDARYEVLE